MVHPRAVAQILRRHRMPDEVIAAGLLHDVLEDTPTTAEELRERFGPRVTALVQDVTEVAKGRSWEFRKNAYLRHLRHAPQGSLAISCADKLHNTRSLVAAYRREGAVVLDRFSRGIDQKLAYHRKVFSIVRERWKNCPILPELEQSLAEMEAVSRAHTAAEPKEVEIKFSVQDPALLEKAARWTSLGRFRLARSGRERQINRYWDTEDGRLRRARAILKSRETGRRAEMTFKRELGYRAGVSERIEVTTRIPPARIRSSLDHEPWIEPVRRARKLIGRHPLREVLTMRTDRRTRRFAAQHTAVEIAVDRVDVLRGQRIQGSFQEVELENFSAPEALFREAIRDLRRRLGPKARISRTPKYVVGLRLLQLGKRS